MIALVANAKRVQVGPVGPEKRLSGVLTVEMEEVNTQTGLIKDQVHTFYPPADDPEFKRLLQAKGGEVRMEVRPWVNNGQIRYEFVRFLEKSAKQ